MKIKKICSVIFVSVAQITFAQIAFAQTGPLGVFEKSVDIGNPKMAGQTQYEEQSQSYKLKGAGYNIWFQRDEFQFAYKKLKLTVKL